MYCPQCRAEYREGFIECSDCRVPLVDRIPEANGQDLDVLIQTGLTSPIAIGLATSLLQEAGIPVFVMDQIPTARQETGNFIGWWNVRVPGEREAEAREILRSVEEI